MSAAMDLVARLRAQKDAGDLGLKTPTGAATSDKKVEHGEVVYAWDAETQRLAEWARGLSEQPVPFTLHPGVKVVLWRGFHACLRHDLDQGPGGARSRTGALQADLRALWAQFGGMIE